MPIPKKGTRVTDSQYPEITGKVALVTASRVRIKLDPPLAAPSMFQTTEDGIVTYDHTHARAFLRPTK